jgi:hypothetical protein
VLPTVIPQGTGALIVLLLVLLKGRPHAGEQRGRRLHFARGKPERKHGAQNHSDLQLFA